MGLFRMGFKQCYHDIQSSIARHLTPISPAMEDLVTDRLSPLIIPPGEITKYIDYV